MTDHEELSGLNRHYIRSVQESDVGWFERNLSEDFLNSNPDGSLVDRAGFLRQIAPPCPVRNLDIVHGARVRAERNSGVYLDAAPFDVSGDHLHLLLETTWGDRGTIRTYRVTFDPRNRDRPPPR